MKKFFSGKRLVIILAAVILIGVIVAVKSCTDRIEPDLTISYIGENYFNSDTFCEKSYKLAEAVPDINGDGAKEVELTVMRLSQEEYKDMKFTVTVAGVGLKE